MTTLAAALLEGLKEHGAREIFGIPGDFVLPFYKAIEESHITRVGKFAADVTLATQLPFPKCFCDGDLALAKPVIGYAGGPAIFTKGKTMKHILIIGGTAGIGRELACSLYAGGAKVTIGSVALIAKGLERSANFLSCCDRQGDFAPCHTDIGANIGPYWNWA